MNPGTFQRRVKAITALTGQSEQSYLVLIISIARRKLSILVPRACFPLIVSSVELNESPYMSLPPSSVPTKSAATLPPSHQVISPVDFVPFNLRDGHVVFAPEVGVTHVKPRAFPFSDEGLRVDGLGPELRKSDPSNKRETCENDE